MNIDSSQIVWLFFQSGFGGDQLYYLLNNTGYFAYPHDSYSKLDDKGKRYVFDLFEFNFHFPPENRRDHLLKWNCNNWDQFKKVLEHYLSKHTKNIDLTKPIIIKGHVYLSEKEILKMAPNSKIIYMTTKSDPLLFLMMMRYKNSSADNLKGLSDNEIKGYNLTVKNLESTFPNGHAIYTEDYFSNNLNMWGSLSEYLGIDVNTCSIEHQYYIEKNKHFFETYAL